MLRRDRSDPLLGFGNLNGSQGIFIEVAKLKKTNMNDLVRSGDPDSALARDQVDDLELELFLLLLGEGEEHLLGHVHVHLSIV